jgi:hypothetical protein
MKRHILGTQTTYFEMTLFVSIGFKVDSSMDYFEMNLHASIAYRPWSSFKGHPNYILVILK